MSRLFNVVFDEAHCISEWGDSFRPTYADVGSIGAFLPDQVIYYVTSATLPPLVLNDVTKKLGLHPETITVVKRSNDRSNIFYDVREMKYPANSFKDLLFLLPQYQTPGGTPKKFMVFCNSRHQTIQAALFLRKHCGKSLQDKIVWYNAGCDASDKARAGSGR